MARAHVLTRSGGKCRVVFHITVPATGNNDAGTQWRTALVNSKIIAASALPAGNGSGGTISTAEQTELTNGASYEVVRDVEIPGGMSAAQANAFLDALHGELTTEIQEELRQRLLLFGYTRT